MLQMVHLIRDPKGETVMDHSTSKNYLQTKSVSNTGTTNQQEEVAQLKQRVSELEKELEEVPAIIPH